MTTNEKREQIISCASSRYITGITYDTILKIIDYDKKYVVIANSIGVSEDNYVCAAGHYSSPDLIKSYVYGLGFEYLKVSTKDQYFDSGIRMTRAVWLGMTRRSALNGRS